MEILQHIFIQVGTNC